MDGLKFHGAGNTVVGWYGDGRGRGPWHLTELAMLWLARTVIGEVGAHNIGACPPGQEDKTIGQKKYCIE